MGGNVRLDAHEGTTETVLPAESVDITERRWPRSPQPVDAEYQLRGVDGLTTRTDRGYGRQLRGCRAELVGDWPDTTSAVTDIRTGQTCAFRGSTGRACQTHGLSGRRHRTGQPTA